MSFSAVKYGKLVVYRFDGVKVLYSDKVVWVDVDRPEQPDYPTSEDSVAR